MTDTADAPYQNWAEDTAPPDGVDEAAVTLDDWPEDMTLDDEPIVEPPGEEVRTFTYAQEHTARALRSPLRSDVFANAGGEVCDEIVFRECWGENVYRLEPHMLRPGGVVVDVGANIGAFTLLALAMQKRTRVVAVEPDGENADILRANVALNGWGSRVAVREVALHEDEGTAHMESGGGAAQAILDDDGEVPVWTMAHLLAVSRAGGSAVDVDFLKLDCEGAEYAIVRSMRRDRLLARVRWLGMEFHTTSEEEWGQMIADLTSAHSISGIIGQPSTGGMLWAHRNDV